MAAPSGVAFFVCLSQRCLPLRLGSEERIRQICLRVWGATEPPVLVRQGTLPREAAVRERKKAVGESVRIDDPFHLGIESEQ